MTREEFEARVGMLENEVEGEKLVTRHILEQTRRNSDDLAAIKTRLGRVEHRLDGVEGRLGGVETEVRSLRRDLPKIVGDAGREGNRAGNKKR